jgi:hypothetical protein
MQEIKFGDVSATAWWSYHGEAGDLAQGHRELYSRGLWREMTRTWDHPIAVRRATCGERDVSAAVYGLTGCTVLVMTKRRPDGAFEDHGSAFEGHDIFELDFEDPVLPPVLQTGGRGR